MSPDPPTAEVTSLAEARCLLYGEPIDTFVSARDALVKRLRGNGERALANEVRKLRKPSAIAAEVNQLVRADPDGIESILHAAELLRSAQVGALEGTAIDASELQRHYRAAIGSMAQSAPRKRAEVRAALEAATIHEASNEDLRSGCLVAIPTPVSIFDAAPASEAAPSVPVDELAVRRASNKRRDRGAQTAPEREQKRRQADTETAEAGAKAAEAQAAEAQAAAAKAAEAQAAALEEKITALRIEHQQHTRELQAALDQAQTAASELEQVHEQLTEIDERRAFLEAELAVLSKARATLAEEERVAAKAEAAARSRAVASRSAVHDLTAALDALTRPD